MNTTIERVTSEKALDVTELTDGDLLIEGFAADYSGLDRQNENFVDGAFQEGITSFLAGSAPLCYHHRNAEVLGKVLDLREVEGKGLWLQARVDGAVRKHPHLGTIYEQIRRKSIRGLSAAGYFDRVGNKIVHVDLTEISVTAVPAHSKTRFDVVAAKALMDLERQLERAQLEVDLLEIRVRLRRLRNL